MFTVLAGCANVTNRVTEHVLRMPHGVSHIFCLRTCYQGSVSQRVMINRTFSSYTICHWATTDYNCTINRNPLWNWTLIGSFGFILTGSGRGRQCDVCAVCATGTWLTSACHSPYQRPHNLEVPIACLPLKYFFYMWKGHSLEVHCTNIQLKIFIK